MFSKTIITLCFLSTLLSSLASAINSKQIPAIYVFGDSLVDSGNNNYIPGIGKANHLPYGIDFGKPTGRCTNGKTVVDLLAIHFGLPFAPSYLGLSKHQKDKITTGINYASAGSGILPETNNVTLVLDQQIKFFQKTIENNLRKIFNGKARLEKHLAESLIFVNSGVNDHFNNGTFRGTRQFEHYLLKQFSLRLQKMYSLGARQFLVNTLPPAGCFPEQTVKTRPKGQCVEKINKGIRFYNSLLPGLLHGLQSQLPGSTFILSDLYKLLMEMKENGSKYGIVETWKPCCPSTIYGDLTCRSDSSFCADRNTYLFFDAHPTQIVNEIYVRRCFNEPKICSLMSLKL